jgi:hypothetical protein
MDVSVFEVVIFYNKNNFVTLKVISKQLFHGKKFMKILLKLLRVLFVRGN